MNGDKISYRLKLGNIGHTFLADTVKFILFKPSASSVIIKIDSTRLFFFI